jgi:hypothetical protein
VLHVALNLLVVEAATDETLGVEDSVCGIRRSLILCSVADETLTRAGREADERGSDAIPLVVGEDLDAAVALNTARKSEK